MTHEALIENWPAARDQIARDRRDLETRARLEALTGSRPGFEFHRLDLADSDAVLALMAERPDIDRVAHLGAQAGVRWSLEAPFAYTSANVTGHLSILEGVRRAEGRIRHTVYASTSSVYGRRDISGPFRETDRTDHPASLYAATKLAGELYCKSYAELYGLEYSIMRFGIPYGPRARPAAVIPMFVNKALAGEPLTLAGGGLQTRRRRQDARFVRCFDCARAHGPASDAAFVAMAGARTRDGAADCPLHRRLPGARGAHRRDCHRRGHVGRRDRDHDR